MDLCTSFENVTDGKLTWPQASNCLNNATEIKGNSTAETIKNVEDLLKEKWVKKLSTYSPWDTNDRYLAEGYSQWELNAGMI